MNYTSQITNFIQNQMKTKTKLKESDVEKYIESLLSTDASGIEKSRVKNYANRIWSEYKSDNAEFKSAEGDNDDGYTFFYSNGDTAIFKNVWDNFIKRQKTKRDSKGRYVILPNEKGKNVKFYC